MNILPFTERDLLCIPGVGLKSMSSLTDFFAENGLRCMTEEEHKALIIDAKRRVGIQKHPNQMQA